MSPLLSKRFWLPTIIVFALLGLFFAWELDLFAAFIESPPRPAPTIFEIVLTAVILLLVSVNVGLYSWLRHFGVCPIGTRRTNTIAAIIGGFTLICPVCVVGTVTFVGLSISLSVLSPFIPLLQVIAAVLLFGTFILLMFAERRSEREHTVSENHLL